MTDITTLRDALQELVDRDCTIVGDSIHIPFASHFQAMRALEAAREAYRAIPDDPAPTRSSYRCIKPHCPADCSDCNYAIPDPNPQRSDARDAARYRWLRSRDLDTIRQGGVFAGRTPQNVVLNGDDLDATIDMAIERDPSSEFDSSDTSTGHVAAGDASAAIPAGFVLVPAEPTVAMLRAVENDPSVVDAEDVYRAMIAAAQEPKP